MNELQSVIEDSYARQESLSEADIAAEVRPAVERVLSALESGSMRVAEPADGDWRVNEWLKKAVLLHFRITDAHIMDGGVTRYFDKVDLRWSDPNDTSLTECGARVVPPATVRRGAHIARDAVLMPSYVNIGAYVDNRTMVDTWSTVGSCAQIGKNVHLSGGVGIGGVLEPLQASPTIIEDNCFIGARSEVVEGVVVERGSVVSMGVYIGQSTKIYDRESGQVSYGRIPAGSVVVSGSLPSKDGSYSLYCAVIVKRVDEKTLSKVGINQILRSAQ